jgi:hypothetical protein
VFLVQTYLAYLESNPKNHSLVASYAQYLTSVQRVAFYIRFLKRNPSLQARQTLLQDLAQFNPENSLEVTTGLVQNIIGEEVHEKPTHMLQLTAGGAGGAVPLLPALQSSVPNLLASASLGTSGVTASDLEKITSIDCFALTGSNVELAVVQEALIQATQLYRSFVLREKYAAAKRFAQHLTEKMWEHHIFTIMQQEEQKQQPRESTHNVSIIVIPLLVLTRLCCRLLSLCVVVPALWHSLDREYGHWRLYIKCLHWYEAWLTQHTTQPKKPVFHPNSYHNANQAKAEYQIFAQKYDRYTKEMDAWRTTQRYAYDIALLLNVLHVHDIHSLVSSPVSRRCVPMSVRPSARVCVRSWSCSSATAVG